VLQVMDNANGRMGEGSKDEDEETYCIEAQAAFHTSTLLPGRTRRCRCYVRSRPS
jgi:hypothetical protein